tara:strand:- start:17835 stop:18785 length:951 start_codon:yes stop_codon:yes gene_type:complete
MKSGYNGALFTRNFMKAGPEVQDIIRNKVKGRSLRLGGTDSQFIHNVDNGEWFDWQECEDWGQKKYEGLYGNHARQFNALELEPSTLIFCANVTTDTVQNQINAIQILKSQNNIIVELGNEPYYLKNKGKKFGVAVYYDKIMRFVEYLNAYDIPYSVCIRNTKYNDFAHQLFQLESKIGNTFYSTPMYFSPFALEESMTEHAGFMNWYEKETNKKLIICEWDIKYPFIGNAFRVDGALQYHYPHPKADNYDNKLLTHQFFTTWIADNFPAVEGFMRTCEYRDSIAYYMEHNLLGGGDHHIVHWKKGEWGRDNIGAT